MEIEVNGVTYPVKAGLETSLLDVIREELGLTDTPYGCGESRCGACTVLLGDRAIRSCSARLRDSLGRPIRTIEGVGSNDQLHPVHQALLATGAFPCGNCVPGMVMTALALLERNPHPTDAEILAQMAKNECRCGGRIRLVEAIQKGAKALSRT